MPRSDDHKSHGLSRQERVRKRAEYLRIQNGGRKIGSENFLAFVVPGAQQGPRIGITVSKKVGGAVVRNRVKRLLREAFRRQKLLLQGSCDLVIVAKAQAASVAYDKVVKEVAEICYRVCKLFCWPC